MNAVAQSSRNEDRANVILTAAVVDSRDSRPARISDLSPRGLLGNMDSPPQRGEFIDIRFPAGEVAGQVRWVDGRKFGVRLRERVDVESIVAHRRQKRPAAKPLEVGGGEEMSLKGTLIAYAVLGVTALSTAYLIVTYIIL